MAPYSLEGRGPSYFEKLALAVNREHIGRLTDLDEQLYGVAAGPRQHGHSTRPPNPGPLVQAYDGLGTAQPIAFARRALTPQTPGPPEQAISPALFYTYNPSAKP